MPSISITPNAKQLEDLKAALKPGDYARAIPAAMNKTAAKLRTQVVKSIQSRVTVKAGGIRDKVTTKKATAKNLNAGVTVSGMPVPAIDYKGVRQTKQGVSFTANPAKGKLLVRDAFITSMSNGHKGVFVRHGPKVPMTKGRYAGKKTLRQRIKEVFGPNLYDLLAGNKGLVDSLTFNANADLIKQLASQADRFLKSPTSAPTE